jgi:phospholipase/carboxylesterase
MSDGPHADRHGGPHADQPIERAGAPPTAATAAVVTCHGRGDSASHFLRLADEFHHHGAMYLAPEAAGRAWYPGPPDAPAERREPWISSAFRLLDRALEIAADAGVPRRRVVFVGFSQGASVAAEYVATHAERYGGLAALAGGLLGPDPAGNSCDGTLDGTPVFLGCGEDDPHVTPERIEASAAAFRALDADATAETYAGLGHAINDAEIAAVDELVGSVV